MMENKRTLHVPKLLGKAEEEAVGLLVVVVLQEVAEVVGHHRVGRLRLQLEEGEGLLKHLNLNSLAKSNLLLLREELLLR
jgi:hypothetical protein